MEGPTPPREPGELRISDDDRHQVAEVLREAAGAGRIDFAELDERLEATYSAKTYADLVPITHDLPLPTTSRAVTPRPSRGAAGPRYANSLAIMSESRRVGSWTLEDTYNAVALMGSVVLDLREAHFTRPDVTLTVSAVMGEVKVIVNAATTVILDGVGVMGEFSEQRPKVPYAPTPDSPTVRVRGLALMGSVHVQRRR